MKINIKNLQSGGYLNYQAVPTNEVLPQQQQAPQQQNGGPTGQSETDTPETYLDPAIMRRMLGKGITTDTMNYSQQLQSAYQQYQFMNDFQRNSYQGRQIRMMLKGDLGQLNALVRSKQDFDTSVENARSNNALGELAATDSGMIVRDNDSGKITQVGFAEYAQNKNKYNPLTNAQLAEQREYNQSLSGNSAIFGVLNSAVGMPKIQEEVYKALDKIGRSSNTVVNGTFQSNQADNIAELAEAAKSGAFKIKNGQTTENNSMQIKAAQQALWVNLSPGAKATLRARAATETSDPNQIDGVAYNMMSQLLNPAYEEKNTTTFDETMTKGSKAAKASDKQADWGPYGQAFSMTIDTVPYSITAPDLTKKQAVKVDTYGSAVPVEAYTGKDNEKIPLANTKLAGLTYLDQAFTANGDKVNPNLTSITGEAYVTEMPFTTDGNGNYSIDIEGAKKFAQYLDAKKSSSINYNQQGNPLTQEDAIKDAQLRQQTGVTGMQTKKFVAALTSSFDDEFFTSRDGDYYKNIDGTNKEVLQKILDPDGSLTKHYHFWQNDARQHVIYIPMKGLPTWNAKDGNYAKVPQEAYEIQQGYGQGNDGTRGTPYGQPATAQQLNMDRQSLQ